MIKISLKILVTLFVIIIAGYFSWKFIVPKLEEKEAKTKEYVFVTKVIDGDTFEINSGERVRMLGIDSPEKYSSKKLDKDSERTKKDKETIKKLGQLSSDYTTKLLLGKEVILISEPKYQDKDKYGRLLRYVYLKDGTFVNKIIVEDGYATAYREYPVSKLDEIIEAEKTAMKNKSGLWGDIKTTEKTKKNKK